MLQTLALFLAQQCPVQLLPYAPTQLYRNSRSIYGTATDVCYLDNKADKFLWVTKEDAEEQTQQPVSQQSVPQQQQPQAQPQQQEPAETDHWVQCDRCRTWRIVPDASWPAVEADTRDSWFCEWATWDVRLSVPHNPPCMQRA